MFILILASSTFAADLIITPTAITAAADSVAICQAGASDPACKAAINDSALTKPEQAMLGKDCATANADACATDWQKVFASREVWKTQGISFVLPGSYRKPTSTAVASVPAPTPAATPPAPTVIIEQIVVEEVAPTTETDFLVDVTLVVPMAEVDLRYATERNFLGMPFYSDSTCYVTPETAERLKVAQAIVELKDYRLLLWDCKRPQEVQKQMWDTCVEAHGADHCDGLVANPSVSQSLHISGTVVDVSLMGPDNADQPAVMPTDHDSGLFPWDDNSDKRRSRPPVADSAGKPELWSDEAYANYQVLAGAMTAAGFVTIGSEWWHWESN